MLTPALSLDRSTKELPTPLIVAVSGGSDSLALMHLLASQLGETKLHCVTVDHNLRPEAHLEAAQVANWCDALGLPHTTLHWQPSGKANSAEARGGRYVLLRQFADSIGAQVIALGHTRDDQAETVYMRAQRIRDYSSTAGLAGMAEWTGQGAVKLWRPLLRMDRKDLQSYLRSAGVAWIDDPSNEDMTYERVQVRRLLGQGHSDVPTTHQLAKLALCAQRSRCWLNQHVADLLTSSARLTDAGHIVFRVNPTTPKRLLVEALAFAVQKIGRLDYRPPIQKLNDIAQAALAQNRQGFAIGRCLITATGGQIEVKPEQRGNRGKQVPAPPSPDDLLFSQQIDEPVLAALAKLLDSPPRST